MAQASEAESDKNSGLLFSVALLAAYIAIVAWVFYEQSTAWPHMGSWIYAVFLFVCPGMVFQAYRLGYSRLAGRPPKRRMLIRLITIPLGLVLAGMLASLASKLSMENFQQAYEPFVVQVAANLANPCVAATHAFEIPSVAAYNRQAERERPVARLSHDGKHFVLAFSAGSIDIDGGTVYYDSGGRTWRIFHNDSADAKAAFADLTRGLTQCPRLNSFQ